MHKYIHEIFYLKTNKNKYYFQSQLPYSYVMIRLATNIENTYSEIYKIKSELKPESKYINRNTEYYQNLSYILLKYKFILN